MPRLPSGVVPDIARAIREQERVVVGTTAQEPQLRKVTGKRGKQANSARLPRLGRLDAPLPICGLLNQERNYQFRVLG
jgi:hypothetical protein